MSEEHPWWGKPHDAKVNHIFEDKGPLETSLCKSWMLSYDGDDPDVLPEQDEYRTGVDCKECCRKVGILDD